jgi:hypothetical protein
MINKENNNYEIEELLFSKISKTKLGAITDVSDQFVMLELKGEKIFDLLSMGCPFDFNTFKTKKGAVTQTLLLKTLKLRKEWNFKIVLLLCLKKNRVEKNETPNLPLFTTKSVRFVLSSTNSTEFKLKDSLRTKCFGYIYFERIFFLTNSRFSKSV